MKSSARLIASLSADLGQEGWNHHHQGRSATVIISAPLTVSLSAEFSLMKFKFVQRNWNQNKRSNILLKHHDKVLID